MEELIPDGVDSLYENRDFRVARGGLYSTCLLHGPLKVRLSVSSHHNPSPRRFAAEALLRLALNWKELLHPSLYLFPGGTLA